MHSSILVDGILGSLNAGFEARILLDDLLVHIQQGAHSTITDRMRANLPTPTYGEVGQGEQIVRVPEQVPPVARIVHIRLIEGTSFGSAIQDKLESPKLELIVPKATAHTKTLNDGHPLCRRGGHWREHKSAAY